MQKRPPYRRRRLFASALSLAAAPAIWLLWSVDPQEKPLTVCWFYQLTGWYCPGCGGTRAAHLFLHGHFLEALRMNPLLPFLGLLLLYLALSLGFPYLGWRSPVPPFRPKTWQIWTGVAAIALFTVLRNLPGLCLGPG